MKTDRFWMLRDNIYLYDDKFDDFKIVKNTLVNKRRNIHLTFKYLSLMNELLKENGAKLVIVIFPYGQQIGSNDWAEGREFFGLEKDKTYNDFHLYDEVMFDFAKKESIDLVNLYDDFKNSDVRPLFLEIDGHFNKNGHRIVAKGLYEYLFENVLN